MNIVKQLFKLWVMYIFIDIFVYIFVHIYIPDAPNRIDFHTVGVAFFVAYYFTDIKKIGAK